VTDSVLESLAPYLVNLKHLHITGCPKVSHHGVLALISSNISGITGLGLEGISTKFVSVSIYLRLSQAIDL
jgi:hypothetical protein